MDLPEAIKILEDHQKWRLGNDEIEPTEPKKLTEAMEIAIHLLKQLTK